MVRLLVKLSLDPSFLLRKQTLAKPSIGVFQSVDKGFEVGSNGLQGEAKSRVFISRTHSILKFESVR